MINNVTVDFNKKVGKMKPMHAVNNGPIVGSVRGMGNDKYFVEAGPLRAAARQRVLFALRAASTSVDVHRIFRNFDADENDPKSYVFKPTDRLSCRNSTAWERKYFTAWARQSNTTIRTELIRPRTF